MMYWYIISIIALLVAFLIIKACLFKDKTDYYKKSPMTIEHDDVVYKLGQLIKIPTVSYEDKSLIDFTKFDASSSFCWAKSSSISNSSS